MIKTQIIPARLLGRTILKHIPGNGKHMNVSIFGFSHVMSRGVIRQNLSLSFGCRAIGKTSIEKCDLGSKLSFLGLHYIVRFTVYPDCIICIPWQTACGKPFYTSTSASEASLTALRFLLQRSNCMVWYDTCQRNCKSQLHQTSLNSVVGRSLDELSQRHAPCPSFTPQRLGSKPSTWPNAFALAIFI